MPPITRQSIKDAAETASKTTPKAEPESPQAPAAFTSSPMMVLKSTPKSAAKPTRKRSSRSKFERAGNDQMRINFSPKTNQSAEVPPITKMISQYAILETLASSLSSADLIHLAATNKEHMAYITGSKPLYRKFKAAAVCDGKGIRSRAHCFGHWRGDPSQATVQCKGNNCQPCRMCEAMVCDVCRYHMTYHEADEDTSDDESCVDACVLEQITAHHAWHDYLDWGNDQYSLRWLFKYPLELIKAIRICGDARHMRYCIDCRPMSDLSALEVYEMVGQEAEDEDCMPWCRCNVVCKFLHQLDWLCIPCFTAMEADAAGRRLERDTYVYEKNKDPGSDFPVTRTWVCKEYLCDCGELALPEDLVECRWCERLMEPGDWDLLSERTPGV